MLLYNDNSHETDTYLDFSFSLLELQHQLLVILQQGELCLQRSCLQHLHQSGTLTLLLSELRISLSVQQLQLLTQTVMLIDVALQDNVTLERLAMLNILYYPG